MPTTIYFSGSISGGREDAPLYRRLVAELERQGHRVIAGAVAAEDVGAAGEGLTAKAIFDRDLRWLEEVAGAGGILVAEVSRPSAGVGYEIATARYRHGMPVICLYRPAYTQRCTAMIAGDEGIELLEYEEPGIEAMLLRLDAALSRIASPAIPSSYPNPLGTAGK
ncbi:MAG: nucleoside 2-deoxyribosyltransferase [Acidobacteria bacterium]|nr:nucleoside 2-deoxyribosyltransferase [Acidobacteriota bacterium]